MKKCIKCGAEFEEGRFCPICGADQENATSTNSVNENTNTNADNNVNNSGNYANMSNSSSANNAGTFTSLQSVAFVFMILSTALGIIAIFPLLWMIPMTVHYYRACRDRIPVGLAFKICSLIFVSLVAGILMLVDEDN